MMRRQVLAALRLLLVLTVLLGVVYPLAVMAVARLTMPEKAKGSLVRSEGEVVGSSLLGQQFAGPEWFRGRPDPFDSRKSGPNNLGPSSQVLAASVELAFRALEATGVVDSPVPADALAGSGSGLDPHISEAYARLQAPRVAAARGLPLEQVLGLLEQSSEGRTLGFLGEPRVNVLLLNLALASSQP